MNGHRTRHQSSAASLFIFIFVVIGEHMFVSDDVNYSNAPLQFIFLLHASVCTVRRSYVPLSSWFECLSIK